MSTARNIPLFIAFRVLFNARFYYPVLGILFLDLGLTLEQYALLNVCWAVAIVTLEIPSGALADVIGRKRMVVLAASLMVVEMLIFAFAPTDRPGLLFALLLLNRAMSGAAEAAASGADEALAYDSLPPHDREKAWPQVLARLMRWQSGAFFFAMITGAFVYDPAIMQKAAVFLGLGWQPVAADLVRWPVYLTLVTAVPCLLVALALREPAIHKTEMEAPTVKRALQNIRAGAIGVATDRRILLILLAALTCDSIVRLFMTMQSNYLRLIELPAYTFGFVGSVLGLMGFVVAPVARAMVDKYRAPVNFTAVAALIAIGLTGSMFARPLLGVWVILPLTFAMFSLGFFVSHYLNLWTHDTLRATVLSFRGMALNLAYGTVGVLFAWLTGHLRATEKTYDENAIFAHALPWLPAAFGVAILALGLFAWISVPKCRAEGRA